MKEPIQKITLDFTGCTHYRDMHERMKEALDLPEHYGRNLSALWDSISEPWSAFITVIGIHTIPNDLQEYMKKVLEIFDKNKVHQQKWDDYFDYEVIDAPSPV